jgi:Limiting CO2-inducible proteins B/C beta carbonyic anhydrases
MSANINKDLSCFPLFLEKLQLHFPDALPLEEYMQQTSQKLKSYGFVDDNTLGVVATCRDEIAGPLVYQITKYWGKTFDLRSLGGFLIAGKTGISTILGHTPMNEGIGRFVFYAMPHIAISEEGEIGNVYREGIEKVSHACGSLGEVVHELASGHINFQTDYEDLEQSIVRQKILSNIRYGQELNQLDITKLASTIIANDLKGLLTAVDSSVYKYAFLTGILIHGPKDTHWIYPQDCHVDGI